MPFVQLCVFGSVKCHLICLLPKFYAGCSFVSFCLYIVTVFMSLYRW